MKQISPFDLNDNLFHLLDREWMLITARDAETGKINTMTASWGGFGILWNKPVAFVFIRPQRYTFGFTEQNEGLTLSFFSEDYRDALKLCGRVSGRDCDKIARAGLTPMLLGERAAFDASRVSPVSGVGSKGKRDILRGNRQSHRHIGRVERQRGDGDRASGKDCRCVGEGGDGAHHAV